MVRLLTVEDRFEISGRGLLLSPELPLRGAFEPFDARVRVVRPDGHQLDVQAQFRSLHVRCADGGRAWSIAVLVPEVEAEDIPIGSEIRCRADERHRLGLETPKERC